MKRLGSILLVAALVIMMMPLTAFAAPGDLAPGFYSIASSKVVGDGVGTNEPVTLDAAITGGDVVAYKVEGGVKASDLGNIAAKKLYLIDTDLILDAGGNVLSDNVFLIGSSKIVFKKGGEFKTTPWLTTVMTLDDAATELTLTYTNATIDYTKLNGIDTTALEAAGAAIEAVTTAPTFANRTGAALAGGAATLAGNYTVAASTTLNIASGATLKTDTFTLDATAGTTSNAGTIVATGGSVTGAITNSGTITGTRDEVTATITGAGIQNLYPTALLTSVPPSITINQFATINLGALLSPDGGAAAWTLTAPDGWDINTTTGVITGTPNKLGTLTFTGTLTEGGITAVHEFSFTVEVVERAPVWVPPLPNFGYGPGGGTSNNNDYWGTNLNPTPQVVTAPVKTNPGMGGQA